MTTCEVCGLLTGGHLSTCPVPHVGIWCGDCFHDQCPRCSTEEAPAIVIHHRRSCPQSPESMAAVNDREWQAKFKLQAATIEGAFAAVRILVRGDGS